MTGNYVLKKPHWRALARVVDIVGYALSRPASQKELQLKSVMVVRRDQLGDIIQTLPFFDSLKTSFPGVKVDFLTTPAGAELFGIVRPEIRTVSDKDVNAGGYDAVFELRGDIRLITKLKKSGAKTLVGYGSTGGGFLLDVEAPWQKDLHAIDKNLKLLEAVGGKVTESVPRINAPALLKFSGRCTLAVHPDAGTSAKKWPLDRFAAVIEKTSAALDADIKLIGLDAAMGAALAAKMTRPVDNRMGKTTLLELINLLGSCDALLTNDSGPAHLMAALGKPVWVVWSGTADPRIWSPRGGKVTMFKYSVPCAPCSRPVCNVDGHPCLANISADDVSDSILLHFRS